MVELARLGAILQASTRSPTTAQAGIAKVEAERAATLAATATQGGRTEAR